jgi:hypothetical protein
MVVVVVVVIDDMGKVNCLGWNAWDLEYVFVVVCEQVLQ